MNGNSSISLSNGNSFADEEAARTLPLWFRLAMPVPVTLVSGV
jgi:hypothetical protein